MPELPDLEVVIEVLRPRLIGQQIMAIEVAAPASLPRSHRRMASTRCSWAPLCRICAGAANSSSSSSIPRALLVINPMLAGRLHYCEPTTRRSKRTYLVLGWSTGMDLALCRPQSHGEDLPNAGAGRRSHPGRAWPRRAVARVDARPVPGAPAPASRRDQRHSHQSPLRGRHRQRLRGRNTLPRRHLPLPQAPFPLPGGDREPSTTPCATC